MKGGKAGRTRRTAAGDSGRPAGKGRGKPKTGNTKRVSAGPPKKGSRKKSYGGASSSGEE
jgi:hypothetical protein